MHTQLRELPKMMEVVSKLGTLYDDMSKLQAERKISVFSTAPLGQNYMSLQLNM